jgi:protein subunit release factor B
MEKTRSIVFIILVGSKSYLYEGQKLSNLKDIQTRLLTLKLLPTSQNKIYEHKIDFKLRERERLHTRKQQIGWKRETDSAREQGKERKRERKEQIRSQDLKLAGVRWPH